MAPALKRTALSDGNSHNAAMIQVLGRLASRLFQTGGRLVFSLINTFDAFLAGREPVGLAGHDLAADRRCHGMLQRPACETRRTKNQTLNPASDCRSLFPVIDF